MGTRARRRGHKRSAGRYSHRLSDKAAGFRTAPDFFQLAVESLAEYALITTDRDLRVTSWSGPAARMFGYSESEIVGESIGRIFTPEDRASGYMEREFRDALERGRCDDERWHLRKDGRRLWCYGLSFPLKDERGAVKGFVKLIRDDSERKRKDDLLRESEERLRLAAESTNLGTWDYDPAKESLFLSGHAARLFGLGRGPSAAGFAQFLERVHPEDQERVAAELKRCLAPGGDCEATTEYRIRMPGGDVRWVRTLARTLFDTGKGPQRAYRLLGTVVDITCERQLQHELERKVRERTEHLSALNRELESFSYSASHDLRAPLRKIAAFSQAILRSPKSRLDETDRAYFERIRVATARMHRLIDDMLELARVAQAPVRREVCDLGDLARRIAGELARGEPRREVEFEIAPDLRTEGDCELLAIALRNLIENAWKFTSRRPAARIEVGATAIEGRRVFFVRDDGAGFDMRFADKLFAPFQRLHTEDEFPGTGVGLAMVERIMRRHGGRVWAEGQVGRGAVFYFTLEGGEP